MKFLDHARECAPVKRSLIVEELAFIFPGCSFLLEAPNRTNFLLEYSKYNLA